MDGTRKYAWWSGLPQGSPDFFARPVQVPSRHSLFHKKSSRKGCSKSGALTKWAALPGWFKAKKMLYGVSKDGKAMHGLQSLLPRRTGFLPELR
jgi:hypothetical protein